VRSVKRAALTWKPAAVGNGLFSLEVDEIRDGHSPTRLPVEKLSAKSPLISLSSKEHLLLPPEIAEAARVARQNRNKQERNVERDPTRLLPPGHTYDSIDFGEYSDRVLGFETLQGGDQTPAPAAGVAWYQKDHDASLPTLTLRLTNLDGSSCERTIAKEKVRSMLPDAREAMDRAGSINILGQSFLADAALVEQLERHSSEAARGTNASASPPAASEPAASPASLVAAVIRENERSGALDPLTAVASVPWQTLDSVLQSNIKLQEHQRQGIAWLWSHYQAHRSGALLADEMGLGKTLQIGSFLALQSLAGREGDRRRSTIIVCPKILVENWRAEMERYFTPGTLPHTRVLRNDWLRAGDADLLDALQPSYFVLSYDAFARYQQDLLKRQWASAVLDESQNIKNPDTYRARAARGLKRTFGICATGTPVENRLRDLWTQFDFLSPGVPFSTPRAFCDEYERVDDGTTRLRAALRYPSPSSPVLHREKRDVLTTLPAPTVEVHSLSMTREQATEEQRIVRTEKEALKILGSLQKLYQHPALLRANQTQALDPNAAIEASPKLQKCIELLQRVRAAGEKALIFTLWCQMQELLGDVIQHSFGFRPNVVNGASNQSGQSKNILKRFSQVEGFGVLVMSPIAAGAGLNVTAANHVIHYGRWWNPAKEDQATARAHRIGQTRNVHVHYLVLHDPDDPSLGFDRKLHDYVEQKRQTAFDFLAPVEAEDFESVVASVCREGAQP